MSVSFSYWEHGDYGDPKTHYMANKLLPKIERTRNLFRLVVSEYQIANPNIIGTQTKIIEYGCNIGRNLFPFYCLGFECFGFDLNKESLQVASKTMHFNRENFKCLDLFNQVHKLSQIEDNFWDISFCMGFLMHLPESENKKQLVKEMVRTSKSCYIYEPYGGVNREEKHADKDGWYLSMVDYEKYDVGLKQYTIKHKIRNNKNMKIWKTLK